MRTLLCGRVTSFLSLDQHKMNHISLCGLKCLEGEWIMENGIIDYGLWIMIMEFGITSYMHQNVIVLETRYQKVKVDCNCAIPGVNVH